ncbi:MAG: GGIII-like transmembrane region-containing protein, partial [Candidatus Heimdallarchaeota archaeon]
SAGSDGYGVYWNYVYGDMNITTRHPVSKDYQIKDEIPINYDYLKWDWAALQGSIIGSDLTMVASSPTDDNRVTALAFDPTDRGGKIATIAWDLMGYNHENLSSMILDACDWLAPRPKAKIAYDMGHTPIFGIDAWDDEAVVPERYTGLRDYLVSLDFTVEKLYDQIFGDTITLSRLNEYDMLFVGAFNIGYNTNEIAAVEEWIAGGGSLLILGDNHVLLPDQNLRANSLLTPYDLSIYEGPGYLATQVIFNDINLTMTSNCDLGFNLPSNGYVNFTGDAFPIWREFTDANFVAAGQIFGEGRIVLVADINWLTDSSGYFLSAANKQIFLNSVEWLTAATAKVLVYGDWGFSGNFYTVPLPLALNDLGVKYYLTTPSINFGYFEQFNMALQIQEWDLVIVNNPNYFDIYDYFDSMVDYINSGGHMIISTFAADDNGPHPLFPLMGFNVTATIGSEEPVYIWDTEHDIFNQPVAYNADHFEAVLAAGDDGDRLEVYDNATALAGFTATDTADEAIIVLRNDEQTLFNAYIIDEFNGDFDDSCYRDNFELWKNEIAFMLRPKLEFTPNFDVKVKKGDVLIANLDITNFGLGAARIGLVTLTLPTELGTTVDPLEIPFSVAIGDTLTEKWIIDITGTGKYTLAFEALYQGFLGTVYGAYTVTIEVKSSIDFFSPPILWYLIGGGAGLLVLIIIITVIAVVAKKKKVSTR